MTDQTKMQKAWSFTLRWQEFIGWPLAAALVGGAAWMLLGGLDRTALIDVLPIWMALPPKMAYAIAAAGLTFLVRRRWRRKLSNDEQAALWLDLTSGSRGAAIVYLTDTVFTLCVLWLFVSFFRLPS